MFLNGSIIDGIFDSSVNEFTLQRVKNFDTQSVLNETQLNNIYQYLIVHGDNEDGQIITLYDQMPLRLSKEESSQLIGDIEKVMAMYH
ncbi:hypothetical protein M3175_09075 [Robertmurraya korlensis]|uniref:hypothetical protein n=1 Tax=Robertmurraya korlensis TaxID=519977 RepID=UPI00203F75AE|nr:hypothetical protein [Robertmurraya korlensis]MCM3600882.1 hypothetical protein [Robertmurraya korlensis]